MESGGEEGLKSRRERHTSPERDYRGGRGEKREDAGSEGEGGGKERGTGKGRTSRLHSWTLGTPRPVLLEPASGPGEPLRLRLPFPRPRTGILKRRESSNPQPPPSPTTETSTWVPDRHQKNQNDGGHWVSVPYLSLRTGALRPTPPVKWS